VEVDGVTIVKRPVSLKIPLVLSAVLDIAAANTTPVLQDQAMAKAQEFLPGL
jgi:hypothetical protein